MTEAIKLTISLVCTNERHFMERLMPTMVKALEGISHEILVVDNISTDGLREFLEKEYPQVICHRNETRLGYGANHNINMAAARGEYFAIMNVDMTVESSTFRYLVEYMDRDPSAGMSCPRVFNPDGSDQYLNKRYPSVLDLVLRRFAPRFIQQKMKSRMDRYEMRDVGYERMCDVEFVSGCFMFCRTAIVRQVGGFDTRFFAYFEDTDLTRRVQGTNHRTVYVPESHVTHWWQRSSHKSWYWLWRFIQSGFRYFNRWGYKIA